MTARDAGGIVSRVLAIYLAVQAIQYGSMTTLMLQPSMRFATRRNLPVWQYYAVPAALFLIGAGLLWWYSNRSWPRDSEAEIAVEFDQIKRLAFVLLGAYFLISAAPSAIGDVMSTLRADVFTRPIGIERWIYDFGATLVGLGLVVVNTRGEGVPGFDEMRSKS